MRTISGTGKLGTERSFPARGTRFGTKTGCGKAGNARMAIGSVLVCAMILAPGGEMRADVLTLVNGDRISGTLMDIDRGAESILFDSEIFGAIAIPLKEIAELMERFSGETL